MRDRLLLVALALAAFGASLGGPFHFDDYAIFDQRAWPALPTRPLTWLTFQANLWLGPRDPSGWHVVNLALHVAAVLLLYACLRRLAPQAALAAAAIFAVHPLQAEPVNYIFSRAIVLAAVLCLASWRDWLAGRHWRAVAWFAAAMLAKEEVAAFPLFLLLLHLSISRNVRELRPIGAMLAVAAAVGLRALLATRQVAGAGFGAHISPGGYFLAQGPVLLRYARLFFVPWGFSIDPVIAAPPPWLGIAAWLAIVAAAAAGAVRPFAKARAGFWLLGGLVLLLPSSSLFPADDLAADRRLYLPLAAFSVCAALVAQRLPRAIPAFAIAILAALSFERTLVWNSDRALWEEAVRRAPGKLRPKIHLSRAMPPPEALAVLAEAKKLAPDSAEVASETGKVFLAQQNPAAALAEFGRALALTPADPRAFNNRGVALAMMGQTDAARNDFTRALAAEPCLFDALLNLRRLGQPAASSPDCRFSRDQLSSLR